LRNGRPSKFQTNDYQYLFKKIPPPGRLIRCRYGGQLSEDPNQSNPDIYNKRTTDSSTMTEEQQAVMTVARLMALSARTAPKGRGMDEIVITIVAGKDLATLSEEMKTFGEDRDMAFFVRDGTSVASCDACVLIGVHGEVITGIDCEGCGFPSCKALSLARSKIPGRKSPFAGPNCIIRITDLGIAVGSAVKTAQIHNLDNRVMYTAGVASRRVGWMDGCSVVYGIPLKASGKNIFFDR
jgi:uncharacterized ferredoxin-like protein